MKWKALIALFLLLTPILVPATQSVLEAQEVSILLIDEEKGKEGKGAKLFSPVEEHLIPSDLYFHYSELHELNVFRGGLLTKPFCKRHTQPPDFS